MDGPAVAELMAHVAAAVSRRAAAVSGEVYEVILREIPELRDDKSVLTLLASSVHSNVGTCLQVMQHQIDLSAVQAPAAALEYARRRAQRGTSLTALLRQYDVGVVCWAGDATATDDNITRLEHAISHVAGKAACPDPVFLPRDVSSAWAWLPLGIRDTFDAAGASTAGVDGDIHFAFGDAAKGVAGFRLTHQQAVAAQAVALAAGSPPRVVAFCEVATVAMMLGSLDLLRAWVLSTLGDRKSV